MPGTLLLIAATALAAACNYSHVTVPLDTPAAQSCADACSTGYRSHRNPRWYQVCLRECPGARRADGECSDRERPPVAVCSQDVELKGVVAVAVVLGVIALVVGGVFLSSLEGLGDTIE